MRRLLPVLLLLVLGYVVWFYWQEFTDRPLRQPLLRTDPATVSRMTVGEGEETFTIAAADRRWTVRRGNTELYDQDDRVAELLTTLAGLRTDSVVYRFPQRDFSRLALTTPAGGREELDFAFATHGPHRARVVATGDVYALAPAGCLALQRLLRFGAYRGERTVADAVTAVDSVRVWYGDSLAAALPPAAQDRLAAWLMRPARPAAPVRYADYFDEVMDQDKALATYVLYAADGPHRVRVYRDSLWPAPFVIVGEDHPRRYLAADSLR